MALTSELLTGYQVAEFTKAARLRMLLLCVQIASAVPAALAVVTEDGVRLYWFGVLSLVMLLLWWLIAAFYQRCRSAAQGARRANLIINGLGETPSPAEMLDILASFTVTEATAWKNVNRGYYASATAASPKRLGEILEESAFYTEDLQRFSGFIMKLLVALFLLISVAVAIKSIPSMDRPALMTGTRIFLAVVVFVLSADVLGALRAHGDAARIAELVRRRMSAAYLSGYPMADVLLALGDYGSAVEAAPEVLPFVYPARRKHIDARWSSYQSDRDQRAPAS